MKCTELLQESHDWVETFTFAEGFTAEDVTEVIAHEEGENDGERWIAVLRLKDGRYAFIAAGCDYTGWDCRSGGWSEIADSLEHLVQFVMTEGARNRLVKQLVRATA